jgi:hypothetical protein
MFNQIVTFFFYAPHIGFLLGKRFFSHFLEVLLVLSIGVESMTKWCPLSLVDEFVGGTRTLFFIAHNPVINIHIIYS